MDVLKLPFNEGAFEAVIDKGTMDSILVLLLCLSLCMHSPRTATLASSTDSAVQCGEGSTKNVAVMCKHISR